MAGEEGYGTGERRAAAERISGCSPLLRLLAICCIEIPEHLIDVRDFADRQMSTAAVV